MWVTSPSLLPYLLASCRLTRMGGAGLPELSSYTWGKGGVKGLGLTPKAPKLLQPRAVSQLCAPHPPLA